MPFNAINYNLLEIVLNNNNLCLILSVVCVCLCIREKAVSIQYNKNGTFAHTHRHCSTLHHVPPHNHNSAVSANIYARARYMHFHYYSNLFSNMFAVCMHVGIASPHHITCHIHFTIIRSQII